MASLQRELNATSVQATQRRNEILKQHAVLNKSDRPRKCNLPPHHETPQVIFPDYEAAAAARDAINAAFPDVWQLDIRECRRATDGHVHLLGLP
jgi:hypothetical protein